MKYLCLAYGAEAEWKALSKEEQEPLLAASENIRNRGALMAAVETSAVTVRASDGTPKATKGGFTNPQVPLAGFSVIEAA